MLLDGFIEQNAKSDYRQVFSFLRGLLVDRADVEPLTKLFAGMKYPGNDAIPSCRESFFYTYAGEMPFGTLRLECCLEIPNEKTSMSPQKYQQTAGRKRHFGGDPCSAILLGELPQPTQSEWRDGFPSTELCEALGLSYRAGQWDLHDAQGVASLYREVGEDDKEAHGHLSYLRADLLDLYLETTGKALVWLVWGRRGLHYRAT